VNNAVFVERAGEQIVRFDGNVGEYAFRRRSDPGVTPGGVTRIADEATIHTNPAATMPAGVYRPVLSFWCGPGDAVRPTAGRTVLKDAAAIVAANGYAAETQRAIGAIAILAI